MRVRCLTDSWYPNEHDYFVQEPDPGDFPVRQGDVMRTTEDLVDSKGKPWLACQIVHPSCEIVAKNEPPDLHVIRVHPLSRLREDHQAKVVLGGDEVEGVLRVAWANTFFIPPVGEIEEPMFSDFRNPALVSRAHLVHDNRIGALTHDARLYFIRRKLHWEQRWLMMIDDVVGYEKFRIGNDAAFIGPRPAWVAAVGEP